MVATVIFAETVTIHNTEWRSARLSMELPEGEKKPVAINGYEGCFPGEHYVAGEYRLKMLKYESPTLRAVHHCTYPVSEGTKIGDITETILKHNMHHFLFLPYTSQWRWKGCGDHVLHCCKGVITTDQPIEDGAKPLSEEIVYTYRSREEKPIHERVGQPTPSVAPRTSFPEGVNEEEATSEKTNTEVIPGCFCARAKHSVSGKDRDW
ncbi:hypothetical protein H0H81_001442 [Sphagnurus paluster]|uniref:Uncharacterized protein n=1 Tax=Sphagnurus paluster TaxID=117069 RepID=A0A9P7GG26_9AGAR|nr:hypothetical protein H0H81_001442 [Sphagnurus paluster]